MLWSVFALCLLYQAVWVSFTRSHILVFIVSNCLHRYFSHVLFSDQDVKSGQSPLMHAVEGNNSDMVHFLIEVMRVRSKGGRRLRGYDSGRFDRSVFIFPAHQLHTAWLCLTITLTSQSFSFLSRLQIKLPHKWTSAFIVCDLVSDLTNLLFLLFAQSFPLFYSPMWYNLPFP